MQQVSHSIRFIVFAIIFVLPSLGWALPIDWQGSFGIDTTHIDNYRKIKGEADAGSDLGSQEVDYVGNSRGNASFQSYVFKLSPIIIINDSATLMAETTTGYGYGGRLGDDSTQAKGQTLGNALYYGNTTSGNTDDSQLTIKKLYLELYADTATYLLGRHSSHWGVGAVFNEGSDLWDRHSYIRDGVTMKVKIGNFKISPYWAKIGSQNSLTRGTNIREYGISLLLDDSERDLAVGVLYAKKKNAPAESSLTADVDGDGTARPLGETDVKIIDLFVRKAYYGLEFALEIPLLSGKVGKIYNNTDQAKYKARAIIVESKYNISNRWSLGLNVGQVTGDDGQSTTYQAMFLNPNYQIANLMFRYNLNAVSDTSQSVYDSYITNAKYARFFASYEAKKWSWNAAVIWAKAEETATVGSQAYNHSTNQVFTAAHEQSDDLGFEVDTGFEYSWNKEIKFGGSLGYHFVGDYYAYTNSASKNKAENSFVAQLRAGVSF